jgi:hypothetical protein
MALETKWSNDAYANAMTRVKAQGAVINNPTAILAEMESRAIVNFDDLLWPLGAGFIVPDRPTLEQALVKNDINGSTAISLMIQCEDGRVRQLFLGSLRKSVVPYKAAGAGFIVDQSQPICVSNTPFYNEVMNCPTEKALFDLICSKEGQRISVSDVKKCQTAKMNFADRNNPVPVGLRTATVPCFSVTPA